MALAGLTALGVCLAAPAPARADGALPDSQIILTPAGNPGEIILTPSDVASTAGGKINADELFALTARPPPTHP